MLKNGKWVGQWQPIQGKDENGRFLRQESAFRNWVTPDGTRGPTGEGGFPAEAGRYHLYVALICPWASRTLIARAMKGLRDTVRVTVLSPVLTDQGWAFGGFPGTGKDPFSDARFLHQVYTNADPSYTGRATVPILWDTKRHTIVSNESADILRMFNSGFGALADDAVDLYPFDLRGEIDALNDALYPALNNGVYRAGFASSQTAYDEAVEDVFGMLDALESRLSDGRRYLFGNRFTESDIRLFVTLARFDAAYFGLFKCNLRRLSDYPRLSAYTARIVSLPTVRDTVDLDHIKAGYYSVKALNPSGIIPAGPAGGLPLAA